MSRSSAFSTARRRLVPLAAACIAAFVSAQASAGMYKWVDENGKVHYSDKLPAEAVNGGSTEITRDGVPIRKTDAAPTPEQRKAKQDEEERRRAVAKQEQEAARRDRALLASYASEGEIDLARDRSLKTVDVAIQSARAYSEQLARRKADVEQRIATVKGSQVPAVWERELESINSELARQAELVKIKDSERAGVLARYDAEKQRWRDLAARIAAENANAATAATITPTSARPAAAPSTRK